MKNFKKFLLISSFIILSNCQKKDEPSATIQSSSPTRYLYVASGSCYSGGNTTFSNLTSSNVVYRINLTTGAKDMVLADYNSNPAVIGDSPVGLIEADKDSLYVAVENTTNVGSRRIEKLTKQSYSSRSTFSNDTSALSAQLRAITPVSGGNMLVSKSSAIEFLTSSGIRVPKGTLPYVNAPASPCATSTTLMSKVLTLSNGFIVYLHAAASQNRFGFVKPSGYAAAGDCTVAQTAPNANSFPVAAAYDHVNSKLLIAYSGTAITTDINSIYSYDLTETSTSVTVGTANKIYDASLYPGTHSFLLYGVSEMVLDPADSKLYISTAINTATTVVNYNIEKLSYDPSQLGVDNTKVLTKDSPKPFYSYGSDTKCISKMIIAE